MPSKAVLRNLAEGPSRAKASARRRRAIRDAIAAGAPLPADVDPDAFARSAARRASRAALAVARGVVDDVVADNAEKIARRMVELALGGDVAALTAVFRTLAPPAKFDGSRIRLDVGRLETVEDVARARRRLAAAVFAGEVTIEDGAHLGKMLDAMAEAMAREEQARLAAEMREALAEGVRGGVAGRVAVLQARAAAMLAGGWAGEAAPPSRIGVALAEVGTDAGDEVGTDEETLP